MFLVLWLCKPQQGVTNVLRHRYCVLIWVEVGSSWMALEGDWQNHTAISADNAVIAENAVGK